MCGQVGIIFGTKRRQQDEIDHLTSIFTDLLILSEKRGRHATGVATVNRFGRHSLYKQPVPAREFVRHSAYRKVLRGVNNRTTILMGHTRWQTHGDAGNNLNNHPIKTRYTIGTHNGTITNADYLFCRYGLAREAEVDSEVIFRIADSVLHQSRYDVPKLIERLSLCEGGMTAVMASKTDPETVVIIRGDKPLHLVYHEQHRAIIYTCDARHLARTRSVDRRWTALQLPDMRMLVLNVCGLTEQECQPLVFDARAGRSMMREEVGNQ